MEGLCPISRSFPSRPFRPLAGNIIARTVFLAYIMPRRFNTFVILFITLGSIGQPLRAAQAAAQEARQPAATPADQGRAQNEKAKAKAAQEIGKSGDASG